MIRNKNKVIIISESAIRLTFDDAGPANTPVIAKEERIVEEINSLIVKIEEKLKELNSKEAVEIGIECAELDGELIVHSTFYRCIKLKKNV